ncbi:hypothetical protein BTO30_11560 [Domibacillus antri]|uniref:Histidine kinase n=1 Tax=Domibacillus antri TaxID=1714264 RepID=A0A1Q8Q3Y7_9BACI|nr:GGDEF domain-containing phosphodiesterase [Domibacillus antri]OLN22050.1 hypothetical protein BTO30_11560 [Domibacillus antri]
MKERYSEREKNAAEILVKLADAVTEQVGGHFFQSLVREIAEVLEVSTVLVGEFREKIEEVHVVAMYHDHKIIENISYNLAATPCANVVNKQACFYPENIQLLFPDDGMLADIHAQSYLGEPLCDAEGNVVGLIAVLDTNPMVSDQLISAVFRIFANRTANELIRRQMEEKLRRAAHFDTLTGWMERHHFYDVLEEKLSSQPDEKWVLFFIDIDNFKMINDSLGHVMGDQILRQFSGRLRFVFKEEEAVFCRFSGDEFAVLMKNRADEKAIKQLADKVFDSFQTPLLVNEHMSYMTASMGIALYPEDACGSTLLVHCADIAMNKAKTKGKNNYIFFSQDIVDDYDRYEMKNDLYEAVNNDGFHLVYQPKCACHTNKITGFEALIRWEHPARGFVSPESFIPVAEETGLIHPIGDWVLDEACRQIREWRDMGMTDVTVAINVSAVQFAKESILDDICGAVRRHDIPFSALIIEITEGMAMQNPQWTIEVLKGLRKKGILVHLDDFGTGFSSFNYLSRFPVDAIKIDRSFVQNIGIDQRDTSIVNALLGIVSSLGLNVVAEGVETKEQADYLQENGCLELQGFYFSRPLSSNDAAHLYKQKIIPGR